MTPNYHLTKISKIKVDFEADRQSGSDPLEQLGSLLSGDTCRSIDLREVEAIILNINGIGMINQSHIHFLELLYVG